MEAKVNKQKINMRKKAQSIMRQIALSLFCVGQLLICRGPNLKHGNLPSMIPLEETNFSFFCRFQL